MASDKRTCCAVSLIQGTCSVSSNLLTRAPQRAPGLSLEFQPGFNPQEPCIHSESTIPILGYLKA